MAVHGNDTMAVRVDVSIEEQVGELCQETLDRFGVVHVVCNNAGVSGAGDVADSVRQLAIGKGFQFEPAGHVELKGFPDPVAIWRVTRPNRHHRGAAAE